MVAERRPLAEQLTYFAFLALPFIGLPIFPSDYRPASVLLLLVPIALLVATVFVKPRIRFWPEDLALVLFVGYASARSVVGSQVSGGQASDVAFETALLAFGALSYFCFRALVLYRGAEWLARSLNVVGLLLICYGLWEAASIYGPFPLEIRNSVAQLLNGKSGSRIQLTTPEAAWAARVLLPYLLCLWVFRRRMRKSTFLAVFAAGCFVYLLTLSAEGYLTAIATIFLAVALFPTKKKITRLVSGVAALGISALLMFTVVLVPLAAQGGFPYYATRIAKLATMDQVSLERIAQLDESTYIRLAYPMISFEMFRDNPLFGVGIGSYDDFFPSYITSRGNLPFNNQQIVTDIVNGTGDPRNLYGRVLAENGIVGGLIFFAFLGIIYSRLWQRRWDETEVHRLSRILFAASLAGGLQFGSLVYLQNWFIWAFCSGVSRDLKSPRQAYSKQQ